MPTIKYKDAAGNPVKGVTTIISQNLGWNKGALMWWANAQGREGKTLEEARAGAADAGTICHHMIEQDLKFKDPHNLTGIDGWSQLEKDSILTAEKGFENYLRWKKTVTIEPFAIEPNMVSGLGYGATPDVIPFIDGKLSILDWKTSKGVYPDYLVQLSAYCHIWDELHPANPITGGHYLLRMGKKDASFHWHWWERLTEAWEVFLQLLKLSKMEKVLKEKC